MYKIINPQQTQLFDPFDSVLTEKACSAAGMVLSGMSSLN